MLSIISIKEISRTFSHLPQPCVHLFRQLVLFPLSSYELRKHIKWIKCVLVLFSFSPCWLSCLYLTTPKEDQTCMFRSFFSYSFLALITLLDIQSLLTKEYILHHRSLFRKDILRCACGVSIITFFVSIWSLRYEIMSKTHK